MNERPGISYRVSDGAGLYVVTPYSDQAAHLYCEHSRTTIGVNTIRQALEGSEIGEHLGCGAVRLDVIKGLEPEVEQLIKDEVAIEAGGHACVICDQGFSAEDWDGRHSDADGEDVHAACCEASGPCSRESLTNAQAEYAALIDEQEAIEADAAEQERLDDEAAPWRVLRVYGGLGTTVVTFLCEDPTGAEHVVGVEHRPASDIANALLDGEDAYIERPEAWQILR